MILSRCFNLLPRRLVLPVTTVAASLVVGLMIAEAVLRLFTGILPVEVQQIIRSDPSNYGVAHPYIGHVQKPNNALVISGRDFKAVHHTDGYGFRNTWPWPPQADIITLGDSLTFGQGVEDNLAWPAIVARARPANRLINLGLIGAGPQQYLRVYQTYGVKLRPKVVLVGLFTGNDFWDAEMFEEWLKSGAGGNYMVWRDFGRPVSVSLRMDQPLDKLLSSLSWRAKLFARKSYLVNFLRYAAGRAKTWTPGQIKTFIAPAGRLELTPNAYAESVRFARPGYAVFDMVIGALESIDHIARENGATAVVVLQPSKEEVYLPLMGDRPQDPTAPVRAKLQELSIPFIDLLGEFRDHAAKGEVLYFEADGHPNAAGYGLIANAVTSDLRQRAEEYGLAERSSDQESRLVRK